MSGGFQQAQVSDPTTQVTLNTTGLETRQLLYRNIGYVLAKISVETPGLYTPPGDQRQVR